MTDKQKIEMILNLLTDSTVGKLAKDKQLITDEEKFGAMVCLTHVFGKAYKIAKG